MKAKEFKTIRFSYVTAICLISTIVYAVAFSILKIRFAFLAVIAISAFQLFTVYHAGNYFTNMKKPTSEKLFFLIVFVIIVVIPFAISLQANTVLSKNAISYSRSSPSGKYVPVRVSIEREVTRDNNIGYDMFYEYSINGIAVSDGDVIFIDEKQFQKITSQISEFDEAKSDEGGNSTIAKLSFSHSNSKRVTHKVSVRENGGQYSGKARVYKVTFIFTKLSASSLPMRSIPYYSYSKPIGVKFSLIVLSVLYLFLGLFAVLGQQEKARCERIKREIEAENAAEEKRRLEEEKEREKHDLVKRIMVACESEVEHRKRIDDFREKERQGFLTNINGDTIRDVARVPQNVRFVISNGMEVPVDNNDEQFGSFTVYISHNGKCYHQWRGCCSATVPYNRVLTLGKYKPCSKCVKKIKPIPDWYTEYIRLKEQCKEHGIDVG